MEHDDATRYDRSLDVCDKNKNEFYSESEQENKLRENTKFSSEECFSRCYSSVFTFFVFEKMLQLIKIWIISVTRRHTTISLEV